MSDINLVLTLGHNASAIAIQDGHIVAGYEEERFSLKKADSNFPIHSINECLNHLPSGAEPTVFVNHWFLDGKLPAENKYWRPNVLNYVVNAKEIISLDSLGITHHDGHMHSAEAFVGDDFPDHQAWVIDGFGTAGECISIYDVKNGKSSLSHRYFGFGHSLGMFYQYATSYMGMEMHNHEYKILAYEVHFMTEYENLRFVMDSIANEHAFTWFNSLGDIASRTDPMLSLDALPAIKDLVGKTLDDVLLRLGMSTADLHTKRYVCSRFTQLYVENCIGLLFAKLQPENLVVSGGFFYNVKINNWLARHVKGKFSAMPLAGDQGAGLGVYVASGRELIWPGHLFWGKRNLSFNMTHNGVVRSDSSDETADMAKKCIDKYGFVNIVRGAMEFGPRALCNTSTIALPTKDMNNIINHVNNRTSEMPMAPVMSRSQANKFFEHTDKVYNSLDYMITALDYKPGMAELVPGVAHYYKERDTSTGRPQIINPDDTMMNSLLDAYGPLINTSFNYHGVPIVNTVADAVFTHSKQRSRSENVYTIIEGAV